jgi:acyl carrier protein
MTDQLEIRVRQLVSNVFGLPIGAINLESSYKTISNWDSLNIINLMIAIESEFGVTLDVDEAVDLLSVKKIIVLLRQKGLA